MSIIRNIFIVIFSNVALLPVVALSDVSMYGEIIPKIGIHNSSVSMTDGGSNFGFWSSNEMSNGNIIYGEIEFLVDATDGALSASIGRTNIEFEGHWGSAVIGSQDSILIDVQSLTCWNTEQSCEGYVGYQSRVADAIVLRPPAFGPISLALQWEADGFDLAAWSVGTEIEVGNILVRAVYRDHYIDQYTQVSAGTILAGMTLAGGFSSSQSGMHGWSAAASYSGVNITYDQVTFEAGGYDWVDLSLDYGIDLGGYSMVLFLAQNEPQDTLFGIKWVYGF